MNKAVDEVTISVERVKAAALTRLPPGIHATATCEASTQGAFWEEFAGRDLGQALRMIVLPIARVHQQEPVDRLQETPRNVWRWLLAYYWPSWSWLQRCRPTPLYDVDMISTYYVCPHIEASAPSPHSERFRLHVAFLRDGPSTPEETA